MSADVPVQHFSFGYHLNTWDLGGLSLTDGLATIRRNGFGWVEALARDELSNDFARRFMGTGYQPLPSVTTDSEFLARTRVFADAADAGLRLSSLYCNREFVNPLTRDTELATLVTMLRLLRGFDAPGLVMGGGPPARGGADHTAEEYVAFAGFLNEIGRRAADLGMWAAYHPHLDCFIETRNQLDKLVPHLDTEVAGLCIDTAHLAISRSDPAQAIHDYAPIVRYVHFKDVVSPDTVSGVDRYTAFRGLGQGIVDLPGCARELLAAGYSGLVTVELDTTTGDPEGELLASAAYITEVLGLSLTAPAAGG
jgi:inosose dehydratase